MKRVLLLLAVALMSLNMTAQKSILLVGEVDRLSGIDSKWAEKLRSEMISGLVASPRLTVIDGSTVSGMSGDIAKAVDVARERNADCLLTAQITSFTGKKETSKEGKVTYKTTLEYSWVITNVADGSTRGSKKETHYGSSGSGYDAAYADAFILVPDDMKKLVNDQFRVSGEIKSIAETHPKKGAKTLYISVGSDDGVAQGNAFEVYKEVEIAGETISEKIGELKAKDIKSGSLTLCNVTKGGVEIQNAFDSGLRLTVTSRPPRIVF
mgnify:CR=1 FL=1